MFLFKLEQEVDQSKALPSTQDLDITIPFQLKNEASHVVQGGQEQKSNGKEKVKEKIIFTVKFQEFKEEEK